MPDDCTPELLFAPLRDFCIRSPRCKAMRGSGVDMELGGDAVPNQLLRETQVLSHKQVHISHTEKRGRAAGEVVGSSGTE